MATDREREILDQHDKDREAFLSAFAQLRNTSAWLKAVRDGSVVLGDPTTLNLQPDIDAIDTVLRFPGLIDTGTLVAAYMLLSEFADEDAARDGVLERIQRALAVVREREGSE